MVGDIEKVMSKTEGTTMESISSSIVYDFLDPFNFLNDPQEDIYNLEDE